MISFFCHLTITGLGGTALEPSISSWTKVVEQVPELIELVGDPRRVTVRFDPIVRWRDDGQIRSYFPQGRDILEACAAYALETICISFATLYRKVRRRKGWDWYDPLLADRLRMVREGSGYEGERYGCQCNRNRDRAVTRT